MLIGVDRSYTFFFIANAWVVYKNHSVKIWELFDNIFHPHIDLKVIIFSEKNIN